MTDLAINRIMDVKFEGIGELNILDLLEEEGAISEGHFVGTKGGHMDAYINIKKVTEDINCLSSLAIHLAFAIKNIEAQVLLALPYGAQDLLPLVAMFYASITGRSIQILKLVKKRGKGEEVEKIVWYKDHAKKVAGKKVILIDDVINTGGSLEDGAKLINSAGGSLAACGAICSRKDSLEIVNLERRLGAIIRFLCMVMVDNYEIDLDRSLKAQCPLCREGIPIDQKIGHGKDFLDNYEQRFPNMKDWVKKMRG